MISLNKRTISQTPTIMPAIFVGHGNPILAISKNRYSRQWAALGENLRKPKAVFRSQPIGRHRVQSQ